MSPVLKSVHSTDKTITVRFKKTVITVPGELRKHRKYREFALASSVKWMLEECWIDRCGQDVLRVFGVYQNSFGVGKPHEYRTEKDFEGEIMGSLYSHILESYPSEDEDEGLEYMKGTEHPPNECHCSGIDDVLELAPGDSPPGVNEFVADPDWEPPLYHRHYLEDEHFTKHWICPTYKSHKHHKSMSYGAPHPSAMFEHGGRKIRQQSVPSRKFSQGEGEGLAEPLEKNFFCLAPAMCDATVVFTALIPEMPKRSEDCNKNGRAIFKRS
ncbi:hypothetical protein B0H13DRAFT_1886985 [Mycena leptocephala]|nr:hypothetical protein B0H13DRAFT_1886985 [Mycena leptocephala]